MKTTIRRLFMAFAVVHLISPLCAQRNSTDYAAFVRLMIGTGDHGHTHPAAMVPHGMVQPGPDTRWRGWDACSGYAYADSTINGFAYTRLSGTGCADYGDFLLMPLTGNTDTLSFSTAMPEGQQMPWASPFDHKEEQAEPGYYSVRLRRYGVKAEMTATERTAIHRFTFPEGAAPALLFDLDYAIQEQTTLEADAHVPDARSLTLHRRSYWWAYDQEAFLHARFSHPFRARIWRDTLRTKRGNVPRCKVLLTFDAIPEGETLMVRAGLSSVDAEGARRNLEIEMPDFRFDETRQRARDLWNKALARIRLSPPEPGHPDRAWRERHEIFYTALYHAAVAPHIASDTDGRYRGMDRAIHHAPKGETQYTVFSLWDTFRALHPLVSLLDPQDNEAYIRTLLRMAHEGGLVPKWECAGNYTACMSGYHFASLAADAHTKGYRNFNAEAALEACLRAAEADGSRLHKSVPAYKRRELLPPAQQLKNEGPFIPCTGDVQTVAKALEYAYDDWCIARLAEGIGRKETAQRYDAKAEAYAQYFDPATRFMRGRMPDGTWRTPFDPHSSDHLTDDYLEGTAWQWAWFVPHHPDRLIRMMGGKRRFVGKLDSLFAASSHLTGKLVSADISGLIGQYAHGNEPSHHVAYLYNYADRPHRTQELCDSILRTLYSTAPNGLPGNEDCGQMSAWYVLSALGFYQVCPGKPEWTLGRPLFPSAEITLPGGKKLTVVVHGCSPHAKHVKKALLNGRRLKKPFVAHKDLAAGGTLEFFMEE